MNDRDDQHARQVAMDQAIAIARINCTPDINVVIQDAEAIHKFLTGGQKEG